MQLWYRMKQLSNTRPSIIQVDGKYQTWKFIGSISSIIPKSHMIVDLPTHMNILLIKDETYCTMTNNDNFSANIFLVPGTYCRDATETDWKYRRFNRIFFGKV